MQVNRLQPSHIDVQPHGLKQMFDAICVGVTEKGHGAKLNGLMPKLLHTKLLSRLPHKHTTCSETSTENRWGRTVQVELHSRSEQTHAAAKCCLIAC